MHKTDTIIVFQKPELYFFPHYKEFVFSPFGVPERSMRYFLYRLLHLLHIPCCSLFWGEWKEHIKQARQVILFDYGYQRGMETYIRRINPQCKVYLFFWNRVNRYNKAHLRFTDSEAVFSTDPGDCKRYGLRYNHIFYPGEFFAPFDPKVQTKLFFLGADKGRAPYLASLKGILEQGGLTCDIRVLSSSKDEDYLKSIEGILTDTPLSYPEYLEQLTQYGVLLDVNQAGQEALTMRVMEAVYLSKKLITNNRHITDYDFYNPDNILLLPEEGLPSADEISAFLKKPFRPYAPSVLEAYSFEHWLAGFTADTAAPEPSAKDSDRDS